MIPNHKGILEIKSISKFSINNTISNKYQIEEIIGSGKFGIVFKGKNTTTNKNVAIKMEKNDIQMLKHETTILSYLYNKGTRNIPLIYWFGNHDDYTCLIMPYYTCSLIDLTISNNNDATFYLNNNKIIHYKLFNRMMSKIIDILENIHSNYVIHCDIKPQNFMIGKYGNYEDIYLIDFGMSSFYLDETHNHIKYKDNREHIIGTPKYISLNIHNGITPSRRDDLISLGYIYLLFFPFFSISTNHEWNYFSQLKKENNNENVNMNKSSENNNKDTYLPDTHVLHYKNQKIKQDKKDFIMNLSKYYEEDLYYKITNKYIQYCHHLNFETTPNYEALKRLFEI